MGSAPSAPAPVAPVYTDPVNGQSFNDSNLLNEEIRQRKLDEQNTSDAAAAKATQDQADLENKYQANLSSARGDATNRARDAFTRAGLNPDQYLGEIDAGVNNEARKIGDLDPNPQSGFSDNLGATILANLTSQKSKDATRSLGGIFSPTYAQDNLQYSEADPYTSTTLASQFDPLQSQLDNSQRRGTLNDTGYAAALKALTDAKTQAQSTVSGLAKGVIDSDRGNVNDYITSAQDAASKYDFTDGGTFDPASYQKNAQDIVAQSKAKLGGDISNAVGNSKFADITQLLNAGGAAQGATDPTAANPNSGGGGPSASYIADQVLGEQKRGLGSTGAF